MELSSTKFQRGQCFRRSQRMGSSPKKSPSCRVIYLHCSELLPEIWALSLGPGSGGPGPSESLCCLRRLMEHKVQKVQTLRLEHTDKYNKKQDGTSTALSFMPSEQSTHTQHPRMKSVFKNNTPNKEGMRPSANFTRGRALDWPDSAPLHVAVMQWSAAKRVGGD